MFPLLERKEW